MRLLHSLLLLCLLLSLPVNSVMAGMMPLCLPGTEQPAGVRGMHGHMAGAQASEHAPNNALDACKLACEKCSVCAQAALPPTLIPLAPLPLTTARALLADPLLLTPAPTPPFRPPLPLL
ncbi:hypothetical protein [Pseudomonas sp.]|uniref:hypothetical protein n=1 Tax=Pseudomonas sp. TaxID=306 RepID=UPI0027329F37|nr:hypothetical protein [Pseudomonas sp.]MDP3817120.1 hypothetical protein [Pseudomonas sp.]